MLCNIKVDKKFSEQFKNSQRAGTVTLERAYYLAKISELINFHLSDIGKLPEPGTANESLFIVV